MEILDSHQNKSALKVSARSTVVYAIVPCSHRFFVGISIKLNIVKHYFGFFLSLVRYSIANARLWWWKGNKKGSLTSIKGFDYVAENASCVAGVPDVGVLQLMQFILAATVCPETFCRCRCIIDMQIVFRVMTWNAEGGGGDCCCCRCYGRLLLLLLPISFTRRIRQRIHVIPTN